MGAPLSNDRMDMSDPALALSVGKGERSKASSANQPGKPEGMVLPWLMTMPSPHEDIKFSNKLGNVGANSDEKLETAQPSSVPEGPTPATQLMPVPERASPFAAEVPTTGEGGTAPSHPYKPGVIAPWFSKIPRLDEVICEKGNDTDLKRLLRIAEDEVLRAAAAVSVEKPNENFGGCAPELPCRTSRLQLKEELPNCDITPHPAEVCVVLEADIGARGNSHAALDWETSKSDRGLDGSNERDNLWPRASPPIVEEEVASTENELERSWMRAVSLVPNAPNGIVDKQPDVAGPAQSSSRKGSLIILGATIFTASALGIGATGLRPFSNLPPPAEMPPSLANVSPKEKPVETEGQNVQGGLSRTETSSQPIVSAPPASSAEAGTSVAMQPSPEVPPRSIPSPPTPPAEQKSDSEEKRGAASAQNENFSFSRAPQRGDAPLGWRSFEVPEFGTRVQIPAGIFSPAGKPEQGSGQRFQRADGRAVLSVYSRPNSMRESPATYLRHNLRADRSALDYERVARSFFAISLERDGVILYSRCNFSSRASAAIHCFDLTYPQEEKRSWDAVVTRISLSLRPLEG